MVKKEQIKENRGLAEQFSEYALIWRSYSDSWDAVNGLRNHLFGLVQAIEDLYIQIENFEPENMKIELIKDLLNVAEKHAVIPVEKIEVKLG